MILRELFDREFLYESKKIDKMNKIFYKFDIKIVKKEEEKEPEAQPEQTPAQEPQQQMEPQGEVDLSMPQGGEAQPEPMPAEPQQPVADPFDNMPTASMMTEDENDKIEINDENNIVRKLEGEITLPKEEIDNIQTVEDLISKLTETKVEGVNVLDEFTADVIQVLADPSQQTKIASMIDKKSMIFAEIIYGKKKEDSIGIRIIKRKNSDMVTTTMLLDNKIINAPYKKETVDERIVAIRNDEYAAEDK